MSQQEHVMNKHILVIDDDQDILEVVQTILTMEGYRVQISLNGACLRRLESDPPDLILLDVLLRGEDGRELCREVKGREQTSHIPVILFSANVAANSTTAACGADDFIAKPFRKRELLALIAKNITLREQDLH